MGRTICEHARQFYSKHTTGEPPIFWIFDDSIIPAGSSLKHNTSDTGDVCHYDIIAATDKQLKAILKTKTISDFYICDNGNHRQLRREDLPPEPSAAQAPSI
jgi:hypothetical protein